MQVAKRTGYGIGVSVDFHDQEISYRTQKGIPFFERYLRTKLIILSRKLQKFQHCLVNANSMSHLGAGM